MSGRLTEAERDQIADEVSGYPMTRDIPMPALYAAVERILADRLAASEASIEKVRALADEALADLETDGYARETFQEVLAALPAPAGGDPDAGDERGGGR